jgi:uncharacterized protein (DUF2252 family)
MSLPYRYLYLLLLCTLAAACDGRKDNDLRAPAVAPATTSALIPAPYDLLNQFYAPYTTPGDPLGFPMKARNLSTNPYRFWRGVKEPFYLWCQTHVADWLADKPAYLRIHGDLHPGNIGTYPAPGPFGQQFGFGAVDFDDSTRLPFQVELLEGVITFQLLAKHNQIKLSSDKTNELVAALLDAYRTSLLSTKTPAQLLDNDRWVSHLLKEARKRDYSDEVSKYVHDDKFVSKKGNELLRPVADRGPFTQAIRDAVARAPDAAALLKDETLLDVARRTQLESAGSEGLAKYLVLLSTQNVPGHRVILYLKQQIPSSAERVGLIPKDPRPPGQRASQDMQDLCNPPVAFNGWCDFNGASYRLSLKEPWSEALPPPSDFKDLVHLAKIWGTVAGALHRQGPDVVRNVSQRLTADLDMKLRVLGIDYAARVTDDFRAFTHDPRTRARIKQAETALKELK